MRFSFAILASSLLLSVAPTLAVKFSERRIKHYDRARIHLEEQEMAAKELEKKKLRYRYYGKKTKDYLLTNLPEVPFTLPEMYSGNVPIDKNEPNRTLFFVFQPKAGPPVNEVTIWLNGGPGCSSLLGFFQENGLFLWQPGTYRPTHNPYAWTNLTNMLWVEQPVGTGFTTGTIKATTQEETAQDFIKFFKNFEEIFGIKNYKIYVTGESYAGRYVPYISAALLDAKDKTYYDLHGALVYDPCIGSFVYTQQEATIWPIVQKNAQLYNFNSSVTRFLGQMDSKCGYAKYRDEYYKFPAAKQQPPKFFNYSDVKNVNECDIFDYVDEFSLINNPCFNIYDITANCPLLYDVVAFPTQLDYKPFKGPVYFNRPDVKKAMHAPESVQWNVCNRGVFLGGESGPEQEGDNSADPIQKVLPQVIEATNRVLIGNGDYDTVITTQGSLLSIQNMTWNGKLGFQQEPKKPVQVDIPNIAYQHVFTENQLGVLNPFHQGVMGIQHYERGLMWTETFQSGHEEPEFQPRAAYKHLQWLLGHIESL